ncbi:MAG: hypothetical protein J2P22_19450, partial [Nocardioides sp.]|nr:hypothetical protein [Nocardioides sp.]
MSVRSTNLKLVGAAGAAALTVGAVASPALAAGEETAALSYSCSGLATVGANFAVNKPPASLAAGQTGKLGTTLLLSMDATTTGLAEAALTGATQFSAKITTTPTNGHVGSSIKVPMSPLGNESDGSTTANGTGNTLVRSTKVGTYTLKLGDAGLVHLVGFDDSGNQLGTFDFPSADGSFGPCVNTAGLTTLADSANNPATTKIVKDASTTSVKASYNARTNVATGTATVKGNVGGLAGTGKVKFTLKRGTHTIKSLSGTLKKGVAHASFTGVKRVGKYTITAAFG